MDKETATIYEYKITEQGIKKTAYTAVIEGNRDEIIYHIKSGKFRNPVWIREEHIGKFMRSKIYSFTENDEYYRQMMIDAYKQIVEKRKKDLSRDKKILKLLQTK